MPTKRHQTKTHKLITKHIPKLDRTSVNQIHHYIDALHEINGRRGPNARPDIDRELAMLEFQLGHYIASRHQRYIDNTSATLQKIIAKKDQLFPLGRPFLLICIDGRVLPKLFAGLHGHSMQLPAGDSKEIVPHEATGELFLPQNSNFAQTMYETFDTLLKDRDVIVEVLDSHRHCAARKAEEEERYHKQLPDYGRYQDVIRKKKMAAAISNAIDKRYGSSKRVVTIQTGFDPETGYLVMGLERDIVLNDPEVKEVGFTDEIVERLIKERKVISTEQLVLDPRNSQFRDLFHKHLFRINYETDYLGSSQKFWDTLITIVETEGIVNVIESKLMDVFRYLRKSDAKDELRQRALLVLANAFNAYLHSQYEKYPYGEHDESVIVGSYSNLGPYDRVRVFSVNPDDPLFSHHVTLSHDLIQNNRSAPDDPTDPDRHYGRMSDFEAEVIAKIYPDRNRFAVAPVWLMQFERYRSLPDDIAAIRKADWSDLATINWRAMDDAEFADYLEKKVPHITRNSAVTINRLRRRAIKLFDPTEPTAQLMIEGQLAPLWVLAGNHRQILAIIPFLKIGYTDKELDHKYIPR